MSFLNKDQAGSITWVTAINFPTGEIHYFKDFRSKHIIYFSGAQRAYLFNKEIQI